MDDTPDLEPQVQHVYDFARLERLPEGATSLTVTPRRLLTGATIDTARSSTVGAVLAGRSIVCTLGRQPAGTGATAHSHPSEQFNYIIHGTMMSDIAGDRVFASRGAILHTPGDVVHTGLACPDEDLLFFAIKDAHHGGLGPQAGAVHDGPNCFAGFGSRVEEARVSTSEIIEQSRARPAGPGRRYVYDMRDVYEEARASASAEVTSDAALRLPPGVTGKLLTGERLHVCVLRLNPGAKISNYRKDNEQFVFVAEGDLEAMLDEERLAVRQYCVLHLPPGTSHEIVAPAGAVIVIAQDKGPPQ
jgi:quercetin dioxygenase-like cupin family protein